MTVSNTNFMTKDDVDGFETTVSDLIEQLDKIADKLDRIESKLDRAYYSLMFLIIGLYATQFAFMLAFFLRGAS